MADPGWEKGEGKRERGVNNLPEAQLGREKERARKSNHIVRDYIVEPAVGSRPLIFSDFREIGGAGVKRVQAYLRNLS